LGVHLVVFTCEELRGPSDLKTAAALKATFEAAAEFAPAILVLQDLTALIDSHTPSGMHLIRLRLAPLFASVLPSDSFLCKCLMMLSTNM